MGKAFMVALFVAPVVVLFALAGCGGGGKSSSPSPTSKSSIAVPSTPTRHKDPKPSSDPPKAQAKKPIPSAKKPAPKPVAVYPGTPWTGKTPVNILIIGSDGRTDRGQCFLSGTRADALHVVSINPKTGIGTILNIPRDSWVYIPGFGTTKINASLAYGGPAGVVAAVQRLTGLTINYYAVTTFCGLRDLVDRLGGIVVNVPKDLSDRTATFYGRYGCPGRQSLRHGWQRLNGCKALYFARDRHSFGGGDFDRTTNQAKILVAMFNRFHNLSQTPRGFIRVVRAVHGTVQFNFRCSRGALRCPELLRLANLMRTMKANHFAVVTLSGTPCWRGSQSAVCLSGRNDDPGDALFQDIRSDATVNGK